MWVADGAGLRQVLTLHGRPRPAARRLRRPRRSRTTGAGGRTGTRPSRSASPASSRPRASTEPIDALYVAGARRRRPDRALRRPRRRRPARPARNPACRPTASTARPPPRSRPTPATWWAVLQGAAGDADADVVAALTGDPRRRSGTCRAATRRSGAPASSLVTALWPALWGFAAEPGVRRRAGPGARRAGRPRRSSRKAPIPIVRVGPQPYGLLPTTAWTLWQPDDGDPPARGAARQGAARAPSPATREAPRRAARRPARTPTGCST